MGSLSANDFLACCGSSKFACEMAKVAPFCSPSQAVEASRTIWWNKVDIPGWLEAFGAHPRIGDVEALKREVSTAGWSKGEQSEALKSVNNSVLQELAEWNRQYEAKFGFVFLICASGKSSSEILSSLKDRFASRPIDELRVAATEQQKITEIRLQKLFAERESSVVSADQQVGRIGDLFGTVQMDTTVTSVPDVSAHLAKAQHSLLRPPITTHVLDVSRGRPGAGIEVRLDVWKGYSTNDESGEWTNIGSSVTNSDGRSGALMAPSNSVSAGRYKLTFNTAKYFSNLSNISDLGASFYPYVSVIFEIKPAQVSEHFHVPVLLSPFSYTTYRGS